MQIQFRCGYRFRAFEVEELEVIKWLNITAKENETKEELEQRVQATIDTEYNKPEYNITRRDDRHKGNTLQQVQAEMEGVDNFEPSLSEIKDDRYFYTSEMDKASKESYEAVELFVYSTLKNDVAELFMRIRIDGIPINEQAQSMLDPSDYATEEEYSKAVARLANSISQKLKRATKKLKKYFYKASDFGICQGYLVGECISSNKKQEVK